MSAVASLRQHLHRLPGYMHSVVVLASVCHCLYGAQPAAPQQASSICSRQPGGDTSAQTLVGLCHHVDIHIFALPPDGVKSLT